MTPVSHRYFATCTPIALAVSTLASSVFDGAGTQDWPQFLGPNRNGAAASAIPANAQLTVAWRQAVPTSGSGIVVAGDRVYTTGADDESEVLVALDAARGTEAWRAALGPSIPAAQSSDVSRAIGTPAAAGDLVFAIGSDCVIRAFRAASGDRVWQRELADESPTPRRVSSCNTQPLVAGSRVMVSMGGQARSPRVAAVDAATGKPAWTATDMPAFSDAAPGLMGAGATSRVLTGPGAFDVQSGAIVWQIDRKGQLAGMAPLALPGNRVLVQTWADSSLYDVSGSPRELWTSAELSAPGPPVSHGQHLYGFGGNSFEFFKCVEAATGKARWSNRLYHGFHSLAGDTLVVVSAWSGLLRLISADPAEYRELSRLQIFPPGTRAVAPPAISGRRIFVRGLEEVVAVDAR